MAEPSSLPGAASVSCTGLRKSYEAELDGHRWRHAVLRDVSLAIRAGRCTAVVGAGLGPVTVIRCLAGIVTPDRGSIRWRDGHGRPAAPPACALVAAGWRPYACHTVRDALEQAVPPGLGQAAADLRVADAARRCALTPSLHARASTLPAATVRLVATAAALVAGASWILLDRREAADALDAPECAAGGGTGDLFPLLLEGCVLRALARAGSTIVAAGPADHCASLAPSATFTLASGRLEVPGEPTAARRVAEHRRVDASSGGAPPRGSAAAPGLGGPVATASGPP